MKLSPLEQKILINIQLGVIYVDMVIFMYLVIFMFVSIQITVVIAGCILCCYYGLGLVMAVPMSHATVTFGSDG